MDNKCIVIGDRVYHEKTGHYGTVKDVLWLVEPSLDLEHYVPGKETIMCKVQFDHQGTGAWVALPIDELTKQYANITAKPKLKIVSQGTGATTKLYLIKPDGSLEDVTLSFKVKKLTWVTEARSIAKAILECNQVEIDAMAEIDIIGKY